MLANARSHIFWPGLDATLWQMRLQCRQFNEQEPFQPAEPVIPTPAPEHLFTKAVADMFKLEGYTFLTYADRLSGWLEVESLPNPLFRFVCQSLLRWFITYGVPTELIGDVRDVPHLGLKQVGVVAEQKIPLEDITNTRYQSSFRPRTSIEIIHSLECVRTKCC